jgi:hypothetical protein
MQRKYIFQNIFETDESPLELAKDLNSIQFNLKHLLA